MINFYDYDLENEINKISELENNRYLWNNPKGYMAWYGHRKILKALYDFDDVDDVYSMKAYIYHGVVIADNWSANDKNIDETYPDYPILTQRKAEAIYQRKRCPKRKNIFYTGAMQSMYRRVKNIQLAEDAKGTIAYPVHSACDAYADISWEDYADKLKELPDEFQPVNVCLFYRDILNGLHEVFLKKGFKVFCAGHRLDPDFCDNQFEIMRHHKYITTNAFMGSQIFYGYELGLKPFIYGIEKEYAFKAKDESIEKSVLYYRSDPIKQYFEFCKNNFPIYPNTEINDVQGKNILRILGMDEQSPKEEIRKALLKSRYKDFLHRIFNRYSHIECENGKKIKVKHFMGLTYKRYK